MPTVRICAITGCACIIPHCRGKHSRKAVRFTGTHEQRGKSYASRVPLTIATNGIDVSLSSLLLLWWKIGITEPDLRNLLQHGELYFNVMNHGRIPRAGGGDDGGSFWK